MVCLNEVNTMSWITAYNWNTSSNITIEQAIEMMKATTQGRETCGVILSVSRTERVSACCQGSASSDKVTLLDGLVHRPEKAHPVPRTEEANPFVSR